MAELFLAKDPRVDRFLILKRILPYLAEDPDFVTMFLDEARIAAQLHHANIVEVYELGQLEGSIFIAMEWVDGVDLRKVVVKEQNRGNGMIPVGPAAWFSARLCEGLHYAHNRMGADGKPLGIIHRDISPQNVMVSFHGDVKLVDFGIAKASAWVTRSKPGVIKGKFLYLAPEQLTQDKVDHRADLFALGTMLYELTTGKSPFHRASTEAVIFAVRMEDPEPPHKLVAGYPQSLSRVIMKCLEKDRSRRFQSAEEIRGALEDVMRVDAPMTRADASHYISGLYGAADERTSIYVPPNAQASAEAKTRPAPVPAISGEETENTNSVTGRVSEARVTEGRRSTRELSAEPPPTKPERAMAARDNASTMPIDDMPNTDPEREARRPATLPSPVIQAPPVAKSGNYRPISGEHSEAEETHLMAKDQRLRATDQEAQYQPPKPSDSGEDEATLRGLGEGRANLRPPITEPAKNKAPEITPWESQPSDAPREPGFSEPAPDEEATRGPPMPKAAPPSSRDDEATRAAPPAKAPPPVPSMPPAKPVPPGPLTKPPPPVRGLSSAVSPRVGLRGSSKGKAARPLDPDDYVATVDTAGLNGEPIEEPQPRIPRKVMLGIVIGVGVLMFLVMVWALWPSPRRGNELAHVTLKAPKGTGLTVDGRTVGPDETIDRAPGPITISYKCPAKKGGRPAMGTMSEVVPLGAADPYVLEVPCK